MLPTEFKDYASTLPGVDAPSFTAAMEQPPVVSLKLNLRKATDPEVLGYGPLERVPWAAEGFYLDQRPQFTLNPLLHAGVFYVQDASSMVVGTLARMLAAKLPTGSPLVLDMCAAPGGKTTSLINALPDGAWVVANEVMPQRAAILRENLIKWGYPGILVTNSQPERLTAAGPVFDMVCVDAPCSGEGMMRKDPQAAAQWNRRLVCTCALLQRDILNQAVQALRPGGYLIYSTCTFNTEENERQLAWLKDCHGFEPVDMHLPQEWGIPGELEGEIPALRFMPHLTRGEGLFVAVMRKPGNSSACNAQRVLDTLRCKTRVIADGIPASSMKGKIAVPASESVLATNFDPATWPVAELDLKTALSYLRHEALQLPSDTPRGYVTAAFNGHPLGLVKNIGARANNLYPKNWRIRMSSD